MLSGMDVALGRVMQCVFEKLFVMGFCFLLFSCQNHEVESEELSEQMLAWDEYWDREIESARDRSLYDEESLDDDSLITFPYHEIIGDFPFDDEENVSFQKAKTRLKDTAPPKDIPCEELSKPFTKKEGFGSHPDFPMTRLYPETYDPLATKYFLEKSTGKFLVSRWADISDGLLFYLTPETEVFRDYIQTWFDYVNQRAQETKLVDQNQVLVRLSSENKRLEENHCNLHLFHVEEEAYGGISVSKIVIGDAKRLGQFLDTDIAFSAPSDWKEKSPDIESMPEYQKEVEWYFRRKVIHELMHSLGVDHNFALGTVMDYYPLEYRDEEDVYDYSLSYEMDVLSFLYKEDFVKPKRVWPLTRSRHPETYIVPEPSSYMLDPRENFEATVDKNQSRMICWKGGKKADFSHTLPDTFSFSWTIREKNNPEKIPIPFITGGTATFHFNELDLVGMGHDWTLRRPSIRYLPKVAFEGKVVPDFENLENIETFIVLPSDFQTAFSLTGKSQVHWKYKSEEETCDIKIHFTLQ